MHLTRWHGIFTAALAFYFTPLQRGKGYRSTGVHASQKPLSELCLRFEELLVNTCSLSHCDAVFFFPANFIGVVGLCWICKFYTLGTICVRNSSGTDVYILFKFGKIVNCDMLWSIFHLYSILQILQGLWDLCCNVLCDCRGHRASRINLEDIGKVWLF